MPHSQDKPSVGKPSVSRPSVGKHHVRRPWQPKFGMAGLLMFMFVVSYMAAGGYYLMQFLRGRQSPLAFILFTLASPMLLMVVVSLMRVVYRHFDKRK